MIKQLLTAFTLLMPSAVLTAAGSDPALWVDSSAGLRVDDLYEGSADPVELNVYYRHSIQTASLDDRDIWSVSRNGYNQLAEFVSAEAWGSDAHDPDIIVLDGDIDADQPGQEQQPWTVATYRLHPPTDQGWSEGDNGRYVVLLQPEQVKTAHGHTLPAAYLGSFHVAIGQPRPAYPSKVDIDIQRNADGELFAHVVYAFDKGPVEVLDWGTVERSGNRLSVDFRAVYAEEGEGTSARFERDYRLTDLEPGHYGLTIHSGTRHLGQAEFRVHDDGTELQADIDIAVGVADNGHHVATVFIHFHDPFYVVTDAGEVKREGNRFMVRATAEKVVFIREPDEPFFKMRYDLGTPSPGLYSFSFKLNGQLCPHIEFKVNDAGPRIPASADLKLTRTDAKVTALVDVEIAPNDDASIYRINDWGVPYRQGSTIYLDATADGPLESVNTEPIHQQHEYCLFKNGDNGWQSIDFETLELIPEWLRPLEREEVVIRSDDEWTEWVSEHFPPNIFAPHPGPPVDFNQHTLIAVFIGEVDQGIRVDINAIGTDGTTVRVDYLESFPGVPPEDDLRVRQGHMVAIPRTDLQVRFNREIIAFPSPPPGGPGEDGFTEPEHDLSVAAQEFDGLPDWPDMDELGGYLVVFRINGFEYARAQFGGNDRIPARANIEIERGDASAAAHVEVAFTGFPYHTVSDWGGVTRHGNHFVLNATASQIQFVSEPDLPYFERNTYQLPVSGDPPPDGEPIDFKSVESNIQIETKQNVVIHSTKDWWRLIGFEPGPLVLPPPNPVDFDTHTLIGVFREPQPTGCYGVKIMELILRDGVINTYYQLRDQRPNELCTQAIVYPASLVAIAKTGLPIDFIEIPDPGTDEGPLPVEPDGGIGDGAEPIPFGDLVPGTLYTVEFRINGIVYADNEFVLDGGGTGGDKIPARASIEIEHGNEAVAAHVEVAFTGAPYHSISNWGSVIQVDNHFILDATATEILFIQQPDLPYFEKHSYRLPVYDDTNGTPIDFEEIHSDARIEPPRTAVMQTVEDWWRFIGFVPGPLVDPLPDPIDFSSHTLIGVALGEKPDSCFGVSIIEVLQTDGALHVSYRLREPRPDEGCADVLTYPLSLIAIEKRGLPVRFIELPDNGLPVEGDNGIGDGADPLPPVFERGPVYTVEFRINGVAYAKTEFRVNDVVPDLAPDSFIEWLRGFDTSNDAENQGAAPSNGDDLMKRNLDGDRWSDFEEFLLGLNPTDRLETPVIRPEWIRDGDGAHLAISFQRRKDAVQYADFIIECSDNLLTWSGDQTKFQLIGTRELNADLEEVTVCLKASADTSWQQFLRLTLREKASVE